MYFKWANKLPTTEEKAQAALELCHSLIIVLANVRYEIKKTLAK